MITLEQLRTQYKPHILELAKKHGVEIDLVSDASLRPRVANTILSEAIPL
jgi:predicted nucleotidyltransferase